MFIDQIMKISIRDMERLRTGMTSLGSCMGEI